MKKWVWKRSVNLQRFLLTRSVHVAGHFNVFNESLLCLLLQQDRRWTQQPHSDRNHQQNRQSSNTQELEVVSFCRGTKPVRDLKTPITSRPVYFLAKHICPIMENWHWRLLPSMLHKHLHFTTCYKSLWMSGYHRNNESPPSEQSDWSTVVTNSCTLVII